MNEQTRQGREGLGGVVGTLRLKRFPIGKEVTYNLMDSDAKVKCEVVAKRITREEAEEKATLESDCKNYVEILKDELALFDKKIYEGGVLEVASHTPQRYFDKFNEQLALYIGYKK